MKYRQLGNSDLRVSAIGLGGNTFGPPRLDEAQSVRVLHAAQDLGVNFVDTAMVYGEGQSEAFIGTAMQGRRDKWVIATKYNFRNLGDAKVGDFIAQCAENSLRKLKTDYIDLYQLHFPNLKVREEEILLAMDRLVKAGKVREIGASGHTSWHLSKNIYLARAMGVKSYITAMDHWNLLRRQVEQELTGFAEAYQLSIIPYFPLGGGFLTGKYKKDQPPPPGSRGAEGSGIISKNTNDRNWGLMPGIEAFAQARGRTTAELALAWLLAHPVVGAAITGVSSPEQVALNVKAAEWELTPQEKAELDALAPREGDDSGPVGARAAA